MALCNGTWDYGRPGDGLLPKAEETMEAVWEFWDWLISSLHVLVGVLEGTSSRVSAAGQRSLVLHRNLCAN